MIPKTSVITDCFSLTKIHSFSTIQPVKAKKRTSTLRKCFRELLDGEKKHRTERNKTLELYVFPALKEALFIDSGRDFSK